MFSSFKYRADKSSSLSRSRMYKKILSQWKSASVLNDLSFETKGYWTFLDHLRLYCYCHLLDYVLSLILITGTLEYDILHFGYLGFALVFFRKRLKILKQGNSIFRFLRLYNFVLIVLSLAYQSPFVGDFSKKSKIRCIKELVGFHKYDYGFRITSKSALVEIVIFMLASLQSYMFSFQEFAYVSIYLEKEQIGVVLRQQEMKSARKIAQLQQKRKAEELKRLRSLQVEKMKSEMLNLQNQFHKGKTYANFRNVSLDNDALRRRRNLSFNLYRENEFRKQDLDFITQTAGPSEINDSLLSERAGVGSMVPGGWKHFTYSPRGIAEANERTGSNYFLDSEPKNHSKIRMRRKAIVSTIHLVEKGVSQVQFLGNMAIRSLMNFLNIENEELESSKDSSDDEVYYEIENQNSGGEYLEPTFSALTISEENVSDSAWSQIGIILRFMWSRMKSNNEVVCYCCFILIYIWNFSLISVAYLAALFLYALCQNTGPTYRFWTIVLIYTEMCILLQYLYQSIIQHCGLVLHVDFLEELGFPENKITSSFVTSNLPFFLTYLFTLLQISITIKAGGWTKSSELRCDKKRNQHYQEENKSIISKKRVQGLYLPLRNVLKRLYRSILRYWKSLTCGAETPPYYVQLSFEVNSWPDGGIQPERIESKVNKVLKILHDMRCKENPCGLQVESRVRVQSIQKSEENESLCLAVFEVLHASPTVEFTTEEWYSSLTPAADVANEILEAQSTGIFEKIGFPYQFLSVIGGGKKEIDLYAYMFCADLVVFFLIAIFYQTVMKANSEFLEVYQLEDQFPEDFVFVLMVKLPPFPG